MESYHGTTILSVRRGNSVANPRRLAEVCTLYRPAWVYHAAAYKHVPMVEHNPAEGIKNNVLGTLNMAQLSVAHGVNDFVLISTDKAVRPTNVMGASKRLAEMVLQAQAAQLSGQMSGQVVKPTNTTVQWPSRLWLVKG